MYREQGCLGEKETGSGGWGGEGGRGGKMGLVVRRGGMGE